MSEEDAIDRGKLAVIMEFSRAADMVARRLCVSHLRRQRFSRATCHGLGIRDGFSTIKPNGWPSRLIVAATSGTGRTGAPHCVSSCAGASVSVSVRQVSTNGHLRIEIGAGASVPAFLAGMLAAWVGCNIPHSPVPPSAEWV